MFGGASIKRGPGEVCVLVNDDSTPLLKLTPVQPCSYGPSIITAVGGHREKPERRFYRHALSNNVDILLVGLILQQFEGLEEGLCGSKGFIVLLTKPKFQS